MSSHDLRRQLADLRAMVEALQPALRIEDYLAAWCGEQGEVFENRRAEIVRALLADGHYSFKTQMRDDPPGFPSEFMVWWLDRAVAPQCIRLMRVRNWRLVHGDLPKREATVTPPAADAADEEPPLHVARSDLAVVPAGGHSELSAAPADGHATERERERALAAEIARVQAAIAALDGEIARRQPGPPSPVTEQPPAPPSIFQSKIF